MNSSSIEHQHMTMFDFYSERSESEGENVNHTGLCCILSPLKCVITLMNTHTNTHLSLSLSLLSSPLSPSSDTPSHLTFLVVASRKR